jgi:3-oxoacyl-[acyl-carrier-protein] synthase II
MPSTPRRAVFTGLGVITPIGSDPAAFRSALLAGTPGVRPVRLFDPTGLPCHIAGEITDFDAKKIVSKEARKGLKVMSRTVQLGLCAAQKAMDDGGPKPGQLDPFRFGVEFGCVMIATDLDDLVAAAKVSTNCTPRSVDLLAWGGKGLEQVQPLWMLKYLPNMPACHTSIAFDAQGPNNTITESEAAGLLALGEAYRILARDAADYFLVGGCEGRVHPLSMARVNKFGPLTRRNDSPETAVRPFDKDRDGTALGEGAAVFGLEELETAKRRGAKVYAELVGFASGFDRGRKGAILARVIRNALTEAGIQPADVDHVNAHAAGVPELDAFEARAIHEVFGESTPVYSLKGQVGNSGAASGLVELAASVLALHHGQLPGTVNHTTPDPACPVRVHTGGPRPVTKPYAVKISYTDLGQCAAAVVKKWDDHSPLAASRGTN